MTTRPPTCQTRSPSRPRRTRIVVVLVVAVAERAVVASFGLALPDGLLSFVLLPSGPLLAALLQFPVFVLLDDLLRDGRRGLDVAGLPKSRAKSSSSPVDNERQTRPAIPVLGS